MSSNDFISQHNNNDSNQAGQSEAQQMLDSFWQREFESIKNLTAVRIRFQIN